MYTADQAGSPLGCIAQYQVCMKRSSNTVCSKLSGIFRKIQDVIGDLNPSDFEAAVMGLFLGTLPPFYELFQQISFLGPEILEAKYTLSMGGQIGLPKNQWQREVARWPTLQLSALQHLPIRFATGVPDERLLDWIPPPSNAPELFFAQNQVRVSAVSQIVR